MRKKGTVKFRKLKLTLEPPRWVNLPFLIFDLWKIGSVAYVELIFTDFSYVGYTCHLVK